MTREEAIYCLKSYQPDAPDDMCQKCKYRRSTRLSNGILTCKSAEARDMAISALESQIPMKPKMDNKNCICYCPVCDSEVDWKQYCEECGQKISWSEI